MTTKGGRPKTRKEAKYFPGRIYLDLPKPIRKAGKLVGYKWVKTDLIKLLKEIPNYNPFLEADGFYFDTDEAERIVHFIIEMCTFPEGELTGMPFVPERWQWAIYLNIYGWFTKGYDYKRRYTEVLIYVPRKNGKTAAFGAIPSLIAIFVDPEKRSQNFCCAADVEQAALNFKHAAFMIEQRPQLKAMLDRQKIRYGSRLVEHSNGRTLKVLSSIAETKHGLSPNYVGVDEVHAHSDGSLIEAMVTGTGARESPLILYTTTADFNRPSVCNEIYGRAKRIIQGFQSDPHFLPVIYEAETTDDWKSEAVWRKANPNYGYSLKKDYMVRQVRTAENSPEKLAGFQRLNLNVRTSVETAWIADHVWAKNNPKYTQKELLTAEQIREHLQEHPTWYSVVTDEEMWNSTSTDLYLEKYAAYYTWYFQKLIELQDLECYPAFDNTSVNDIASLCLWFPERGVPLWFNWVPAKSIEERTERDQIPYQTWYQAGLINNTPNTTIDELKVIDTMFGDGGIFEHFTSARTMAFDRWRVNTISTAAEGFGLEPRAYPQSYAGMNPACKKVQELLDQNSLFHGGSPVPAWMISNTMVDRNSQQEMKPSKKNSADKIDGVVALATAIGSHMFGDDNTIDSIPGLNPKDEE